MFLSAVALAATPAAAERDEPVGCIVCHGAEGKQFKSGVHVLAGIRCVDCHRGDPESLDKDQAHGEDLRTVENGAAAVQLCASCHSDAETMRGTGLRTDQLSLYLTSQHGQALAKDPAAPVATCVACHGAHAVHRTSDPRSPVHKLNQAETCGACHSDPAVMVPYGLNTDVVEEYRGSVHGRALIETGHLSSPGCTDCHGSHGATPPGYDTVGRICGECHTVVRNYFERSPHMAATQSGELEECTSCHGFHGIAEPSGSMLVGTGMGHCATCHRGSDDPALVTASAMHEILSGFDARIAKTEHEVREAGMRGFFMEREHGYLAEARSLRARARSVTHTLSPETLGDLVNRGEGMIGQTEDSLHTKHVTFRDRKIFTTIFFGVTLLLAGVLQTYRREVFGTRLRANLGPRRRRED